MGGFTPIPRPAPCPLCGENPPIRFHITADGEPTVCWDCIKAVVRFYLDFIDVGEDA